MEARLICHAVPPRAPADGDLSSVCRDGIPPYRIGSKKQLQREMHRSVKANGQVSLPHFPVSSGGSCRAWDKPLGCWYTWRDGSRGGARFHPYLVPELSRRDLAQHQAGAVCFQHPCRNLLTHRRIWSSPESQVLIRALPWH